MTNHELEIWLSFPEVADLLDVRLRDVRALVASNELLAVRRGNSNALAIHRDQLVINDDQWIPLASLRGTITALKDAGLVDAEREGSTIRYRLNISAAQEALGFLLEMAQSARPVPTRRVSKVRS